LGRDPKAGEVYLSRVGKAGGKAIDYARHWNYLRWFGLPPTKRIEMAQAILAKDEKAVEKYTGFQQYQKVSPTAVMMGDGKSRQGAAKVAAAVARIGSEATA
jgi:hypothetical protein